MSIQSGGPPFEVLRRNDEVFAKIPFGGVIVGELVDKGPRCTIRKESGEIVEVDEANVWRNGDGYSIEEI